jgi:3-hydroxyisobutyrate dehydrogenase
MRRAQWRATLTEIAAGADILITRLPGSREVRKVMAGSGVLAARPSTAVWVDMTSSNPAAMRELAAAARADGVGVLDAPVGGGVPAAQAGTLQVFVGGDAAALVRCRPMLEALADRQRIIHVGGNGAGYTAKLLVNLLWPGQAVATGEALLLARVPSQLTQVVEQTYQRALRRFGPVDGELLAVALLEEEAGLQLRHSPA